MPVWAKMMATLGFLGTMTILAYHLISPSAELIKRNQIAGVTERIEVTGIGFLSVVAYDDNLYVKFSLINAKGKTTKADGSGQVRIYDQEKNKLLYERDFSFSSSDFKDFLLLGRSYFILARERGWREFWGYLFSIPREDGQGPDLKGRASLSIRTKDGTTFTREDPYIPYIELWTSENDQS